MTDGKAIPATLNLAALAEAYQRALEAYDYFTELSARADRDADAADEARYLLLGWGEVWDLLDAVGLPVQGDGAPDVD